ncbi:MAG TPA: ribosome-binding factor A [Candidatus Andersenbacteria bacterium]|nr:ribosome-binding factor A [Candidatus Andersenbacteria bacterium]
MVSERILKINKHVQRTVSEILAENTDIPSGVLVTISRVETTPNLRFSKIWLYINPSTRAEETLDRLKKQMYDIQGEFNRAMHLHPLPRLSFKHDSGLDYADTINKKLNELTQEAGK